MTTPKERPILFSAPMVRAILDGSKTQTRRVVKLPDHFTDLRPSQGGEAPRGTWTAWYWDPHSRDGEGGCTAFRCPYGAPSDRLWVRETWAVQHEYDAAAPSEIGANARWHYAATEALGGLRKRPSIFLPRRGSRILLEITDVRVQQLQEISEEDARAEGYDPRSPEFPIGWFHTLWDDINGAGAWHTNPWVWAITFKRLQP